MIYSAITGGKDNTRTDGVKCFTAYDKFKDPRMNAKVYKVLSHLFVEDEYSVWIDGNLSLKVPEEVLIDLLGDSDIAVFTHPYRKDIYSEAEECKRLKLDDPKVIDEQLGRYGMGVYGLGACYLIIRKHTEEVKRRNEAWWAEICRGSVRDQLSFPYVFGDIVKYLPYQDPFNNQYFKRIAHKKVWK